MKEDVRWIQRFSNYSKAILELESAIQLSKVRPLSKLEKQGLIQCFEYTYELAWNTIKDFLKDQGEIEIFGAKDTFQEAFRLGIITSGELWMQMIKSRNMTSHVYDEKIADEILKAVIESYSHLFQNLFQTFNRLKKEQAIS